MPMSPRLLRPRQTGFTPRSISGLALWLDAADSSTLYTTDAGPVTAVSSPLDIAGCALWLDGADSSAASMTLNGSLVETWKDKSGNGRNATASGTARPTLTGLGLNGRSVITFDGTATQMQIDSTFLVTANATILAVARRTSGSFGAVITSKGTGDTSPALQHSGGSWQIAHATNISVAGLQAGYAVISGTISAGATSAYANGLLADSDASVGTLASNATKTYIGTYRAAVANVLAGEIAEIVVYPTALSANDRARVEAYLAAKWGISGVHAPATATNDPVGAWLDKSGNGLNVSQSSAASRPLAGTVGGRRAVDFDGSNDHLFTTNAAAATGTFFCAHVLDAASVAQSLYHLQSGTGGTTTRMHLLYSSTNEYRSQSVATGGVNIGVSGGVRTENPRIAVHTFSGTATGGRLDGAAMAGTTPATGSDQQGAWIGIRNIGGTLSLPLDGKVCEMLSYSRVLSEAEIARIERYLAAKWGITLAPQVSNADAQDWVNRVYANGGTVSATTASAVNQFCVDIENAGIRDRFYRLNLFCGNSDASLAAVRTPLFRGPSLTGTQYGNATDTNVNFVQGDYAETGASGGLVGNGSTKSLNTGLLPSDVFSASAAHLSYYGAQWTPTTTLNPGSSPIGAWNADGTQRFFIYGRGNAPACGGSSAFWAAQLGSVGPAACQLGNDIPAGHHILSRTSTTSAELYRNTSQIASRTSENSFSTFSEPVRVFAYGLNGTNAGLAAVRMMAYSVGVGMSAPQASEFYNAMQTFQTALGRQV